MEVCMRSARNGVVRSEPLSGHSGAVGKGQRMREKAERWGELCALAAFEQDPEKLFWQVQEINELLGAKLKRLEEERLKCGEDSRAPSIPNPPSPGRRAH